jgi:hypothetical protein
MYIEQPEILWVFPQSFQANAGIAPRSDCDRSLETLSNSSVIIPFDVIEAV